MNKNKKRFLSLFLTITLFISTKIVGKNIEHLFTDFYYDYSLDNTSIEKIIDYESSCGIKYVGRYVPQGVCVVDNKTIISLYDSLGLSNSILCVYNQDTNTYSKINLDMTAHVGGICYDEQNELLWITAKSGNVRCYDAKDLDKASIRSLNGDIFVGDKLINHNGVCSAAYMAVRDNKLYVGNFVLYGNGVLKEYDIINNSNEVKLEYVRDYIVPNKTQGICFYTKDNLEYIMFSRSYGTKIDSLLQIYEFNENFNANLSNSTQYYMNPMLEQMSINNDELIAVFEYNAALYSDGVYEDDLVSIDINRLIKKHEIN